MYDLKPEAMVFQFHKGTIKTLKPRSCQSLSENFNSIKVRLKRESTIGQTGDI